MSINQTTQFEIVHLQILSSSNEKLSIKRIYEEINIYENVMFPCTSGNIVIRDGVGLASKMNFDGSEKLYIKIVKSTKDELGNQEYFEPSSTEELQNSLLEKSVAYEKTFAIYKKTDRKQLTQNSEIYTLHFVAEEFILSEQKKIRQSYTGTYTNIVRTILRDQLGVTGNFGDTQNIYDTNGIHTVFGNNMTPFQLIEFITKRACVEQGVPDFMFWQTRYGYNFLPLSTIFQFDPQFVINFGTKNLVEDNDVELNGARDYKIISQFDSAENIRSGVYAGTFIGFDPLTRTVQRNKMNYDDTYKLSSHANSSKLNTKIMNRERKLATEMYDSRVVLYPFQANRSSNAYLKQNDSKTANIVDDSQNYILQRRSIFANLMQKRIRIVMPGNFNLLAGVFAQVNFPKHYNQSDETGAGDPTISGKYVVLGVRHIIRFDRHETVIDVATDTSNYGE